MPLTLKRHFKAIKKTYIKNKRFRSGIWGSIDTVSERHFDAIFDQFKNRYSDLHNS